MLVPNPAFEWKSLEQSYAKHSSTLGLISKKNDGQKNSLATNG